jgi:hypothetical protein
MAQPTWIWPAYYIISGYFVVSGLFYLVRGLLMMNAGRANVVGDRVNESGMIGLVVGVITVLIGAGLLARVEFVRGIVNVFCYLRILGGLCGIAGSLLAGLFAGPAMLIGLIVSVLDIATAAFMIYLLGETD